MKRAFIVSALLLLILPISSCETSQESYNNLQSNILTLEAELAESEQRVAELADSLEEANNEIIELTNDLEVAQTVTELKYFINKNAIQDWLDTVPKLGVSIDVEEWYQFALYYQQKALEIGYLVSVGSWEAEDGFTVWCEVITEDGSVYFFDPDNCELYNAYFQIDMISTEELGNRHMVSW